MKAKLILIVLMAFLSCKGPIISTEQPSKVSVIIDLVNVRNDKVNVSLNFPYVDHGTVVFCIPKTVPGTYSTDNYGRFIENLKAFDKKGTEMQTRKLDLNRWEIVNAKELGQITYEVNDTYDIEKEGGVFSPAGTNIDAGKNFMLNLYAFVGYIQNMENMPYQLNIERPTHLYPGTALDFYSKNKDDNCIQDVFYMERYFELTDNPIMYAIPDTLSFKTDTMEIVLSLYSATGKYKARDLKPALIKTMTAQKKFLGKIDNTDRYAVLLYLADPAKLDARGAGALEHNNSTTVVFSENTSLEVLEQALIDVVSHEFFHILTPLNVHSEEIHNFDFNDPKMSKHLWMYEGVTEYFAQLFQVNQGLCSDTEFFERMTEKINTSKQFDDTVPFTLMSEYILTDAHKNSFYNVYQKGALIGMCLDITLRELSDGQSGILDLMQQLGQKYGKDRPFKDDELVNEIVRLTHPSIRTFFETYVYGETPIPYELFLEKVGLTLQTEIIETDYFFKDQIPYVDINRDSGDIYFRNRTNLNSFLKEMGVQGGDILRAINGKPISKDGYREPILESRQWKPGQDVSFLIEREGKEIVLKTKTIIPTVTEWKILEIHQSEINGALQLRKFWLNG
ncbi:peptidase M61 [Gelidibacter sp. F63206]|uniref:M61 family metallopeptidase n=1 Tax=Gelidibacter sp. F63206 TaxID=2926425 RepID=UPI001FF4011D|nr:peptidase M61 [Gelidibacter sp. F63206]MCK0115273.1 peptidase M61 [Gelidibacter sp. F63206]